MSLDDEAIELPPSRGSGGRQIHRTVRLERTPVDWHERPAQPHADFLIEIRGFRPSPESATFAIPAPRVAEIRRIESVQLEGRVLRGRRWLDGVRHGRVALGNLAEETEKQSDQEQHQEQKQYANPSADARTSL